MALLPKERLCSLSVGLSSSVVGGPSNKIAASLTALLNPVHGQAPALLARRGTDKQSIIAFDDDYLISGDFAEPRPVQSLFRLNLEGLV